MILILFHTYFYTFPDPFLGKTGRTLDIWGAILGEGTRVQHIFFIYNKTHTSQIPIETRPRIYSTEVYKLS